MPCQLPSGSCIKFPCSQLSCQLYAVLVVGPCLRLYIRVEARSSIYHSKLEPSEEVRSRQELTFKLFPDSLSF